MKEYNDRFGLFVEERHVAASARGKLNQIFNQRPERVFSRLAGTIGIFIHFILTLIAVIFLILIDFLNLIQRAHLPTNDLRTS